MAFSFLPIISVILASAVSNAQFITDELKGAAWFTKVPVSLRFSEAEAENCVDTAYFFRGALRAACSKKYQLPGGLFGEGRPMSVGFPFQEDFFNQNLQDTLGAGCSGYIWTGFAGGREHKLSGIATITISVICPETVAPETAKSIYGQYIRKFAFQGDISVLSSHSGPPLRSEGASLVKIAVPLDRDQCLRSIKKSGHRYVCQVHGTEALTELARLKSLGGIIGKAQFTFPVEENLGAGDSIKSNFSLKFSPLSNYPRAYQVKIWITPKYGEAERDLERIKNHFARALDVRPLVTVKVAIGKSTPVYAPTSDLHVYERKFKFVEFAKNPRVLPYGDLRKDLLSTMDYDLTDDEVAFLTLDHFILRPDRGNYLSRKYEVDGNQFTLTPALLSRDDFDGLRTITVPTSDGYNDRTIELMVIAQGLEKFDGSDLTSMGEKLLIKFLSDKREMGMTVFK